MSVTGTIGDTDAYNARGSRTSTGGGDVFAYGAQWGYYTDGETGLILCGHRYYDPARGRWLTRDPIGYAGGLDLYGYCRQLPTLGVDSTGLDFDVAATGAGFSTLWVLFYINTYDTGGSPWTNVQNGAAGAGGAVAAGGMSGTAAVNGLSGCIFLGADGEILFGAAGLGLLAGGTLGIAIAAVGAAYGGWQIGTGIANSSLGQSFTTWAGDGLGTGLGWLESL
jgi:RHS repeat-associated protein